MMETTTEMKKPGDESSISSFTDNPFQRRIEFHLARKNSYPYSSSCNAASDFHLENLDPSSDRQQPGMSNGSCGPSSSAAKKSDGGGDTLEHGLDPELRFEITFRRIGAGLANVGNTCFLNSVLLCLTYTEPFAAYLQSGKHKSSCPRTPHPSPLHQVPSPLLVLAAGLLVWLKLVRSWAWNNRSIVSVGGFVDVDHDLQQGAHQLFRLLFQCAD